MVFGKQWQSLIDCQLPIGNCQFVKIGFALGS
jgi:hypothetical protein